MTLAHLLTHTAGFEDRWMASATRDPEEIEPLSQVLAGAMPQRVEAPGVVHSYSNYGANLATGYSYLDGELEAAPLIYALMAPASVVTLTPIDMAAFMIAHLHQGAYGDVRILETATAEEMQRQQFTHHPELPGMTYGFKERFINGRRIIGHGGDIHTFASQMVLIPEEDLGFFVAYNRFDDALREQLISAFFDHYYPAQGQGPVPQAVEMSTESLARYAGSYRWVKYPRSTLGKLNALVSGLYWVVVQASEDTSLTLSFFGADAEWRYVPLGRTCSKRSKQEENPSFAQ